MKTFKIKTIYLINFLFFLFVMINGCDCWPFGSSSGSSGGGTVLAKCDTLKFSLSGKVGTFGISGNLTGTVIDDDSTLKWQLSEGSSTVLDGANGAGGVDTVNSKGTPRNFSDTIKGGNGAIIVITGTIKGPPKPCTGSGTWKIINPPPIGSGTWRVN